MATGAAEQAAETLYGLSLREFVAERKRLAQALKGAGDKDAAKAVAALPKPSVSAWVVNQLHRTAPADLDALFAIGARMRKGDFAAKTEQREVLARLRERAVALLKEEGNAASEGTLLRVQQTLEALSATGGFEPDPPGQLVADRDPPGFDALAGFEALTPPARATEAPDEPEEDAAARRARERAAAEEAKRRAAEIRRLEAQVERLKGVAEKRTAEVERLRGELDAAEAAARDARQEAADAERALLRARRSP